MNRLVVLTVLGFAAHHAHAQTFTPGDLFARNGSGDIWNITAGGNFTAATPFADIGAADVGDPAWSLNLSTMYVSNVNTGTVHAITPAGVVTTFATGLSQPLGLLTTQDGRLLVAEYGAGEVTDITAGGSFAAAAPFATGLANPLDFAQTPDGNIYVSEQTEAEVSDITAGGAIGPADVLASGVANATGLIAAVSGNGLIAAAANSSTVVAISPTGVKTTFATNRMVHSVAYASDGRLLASDVFTNAVYDITAGGTMASAPKFGDVTGVLNVATVPLPEPAGIALLAALAPALMRRRR